MVVLMIYYMNSMDASLLESDDALPTQWFEVVIFTTWEAALCGSVVKHIRDVAKA
jgi:hypothetical protein